mmetsp:Transcript_20011/g.43523  ORF Transcript_20011/g.43523 Transcript_20011/m.43523 type:complete len:267 (-) Transcript_20011:338-1138(-)|eukprot:CAMPEP_0168193436 /NCGR_PEP_ID=MMETSP0139_2-20121125/18608_1 /TAXON_ID=44445 /ORGANISM="Pseudo-nitzschia australis, Strain 10249 10 AB" /LENGTH=266 /DNA_ID=CAMNT_0008116797 /DNA_START=96 /DNA_END=896 /DNA_ORIENTATION=-
MKLSLQSTFVYAAIVATAVAFVPKTTTRTTTTTPFATGSALFASAATTLLENLPDVEELSTAPFMKQVQYGSEMTAALHAMADDDNDDDETTNTKMKASLEAQLSHSDGIRGFMVAYLTGTNSVGVEEETDPKLLLETLHGLLTSTSSTTTTVQQIDDLVSLMFMNVVMPVAMITTHQDPALSEASRMTAARGGRLLASVFESSPSIRSNARAVYEAAGAAAQESDSDPKLIDYWKEFFGKWGYEETQTKDIAATMKELLSSSSSS